MPHQQLVCHARYNRQPLDWENVIDLTRLLCSSHEKMASRQKCQRDVRGMNATSKTLVTTAVLTIGAGNRCLTVAHPFWGNFRT